MLSDRKREVERWAIRRHQRQEVALAFGEYLATLAPWDWFLNPISFRDDWRNAHRRPDRPSHLSGPPCPDEALAYIAEFLADVEKHAGRPIGWVIAEEFGTLGGRFHCHGLVSGVGDLQRTFWWHEAFRRFGRTRIEPFDPQRGAAFYAAKYAAKQLGALHFGGTLQGVDLSWITSPQSSGGGHDTTRSADLERAFYRIGLGKWHR